MYSVCMCVWMWVYVGRCKLMPKVFLPTLPALLCGRVSHLNPELPDKPLLTN